MKITFKLFASLQDRLPASARGNAVELELADGTSVQGLIDQYGLPPESCHLVLVDGLFIGPGERKDRILCDGETLAIWPPIAGG